MPRREWEYDRVRRVAVLADVDGNPTALEAVAREVITAAPDLVVFRGDLTCGPLPEETWQVALDLRNSFLGRTLFLRGNTERALSEARHGRDAREPTQRERWMLAQHSASTLDAFDRLSASAHAHVQFDRFVHRVRSVNPGSVGMPYQVASGAYWAILGPDVQLCRTEYDVDVAIARYRASNDPLVDAMIKTLVEPPTPEEVIAHAEALESSV
jgi:3',5'-cyclic AMP phosphodiesterase CpdA